MQGIARRARRLAAILAGTGPNAAPHDGLAAPAAATLDDAALRVASARRAMAGVVDHDFYHRGDPDLAPNGVDAALHFVAHGSAENRAPHAFFSTAYVRNGFPTRSLVGLREAEVYRDSDMAARPRILFVSHDASRTGAPAIVLRLIEMFSASGEFECFTLLDDGGERLAEFAAVSHTLVMPRSRRDHGYTQDNREAFIRQLFRPEGIFGANPPLCALVNSAESLGIGRAIAALGVPVVSLIHEFADYYPPAIIEEIAGMSREVVFPSQVIHDMALRHCRLDRSRLRVRGQGLLDDGFGRLDRATCRMALRRDLGLAADATVILSVGTADERKGLDLFVEMALDVLASRPDDDRTVFLWFGQGLPGPQGILARSRAKVERAGMAGRVQLLPATSRVEEIFVGSDLFVLTARADPFPCVVHEAMACGLPVVAFRHGGGATELIAAAGGLLARMGDTRDMARIVGDLIDDPEQRHRLGDGARSCIARDWQFGDYHIDIHESLARHALGDRLFPPPRRVPPQPERLILVAGTEACARAVVPLVRSGESAEVWLVEGRFGAGTERCMAVLQAAGIGFRVLQPDADSAEARAALISRTLRRVRPGAAMLVNLLDHADPDDLRTLGISIEVIETEMPPDPARIARMGANWREVTGALMGPLAADR